MQNTLCVKKQVKKDVNKVVLGVIIYTIILISVIMCSVLGEIIIYSVQNPELINMSNEELEPFFNQILEKGTSSVVGVILGTLFLTLFFRKDNIYKKIFCSKKQMSCIAFGKLFCIFMGVQLICNLGISGIETIFNLFGYTTFASIETATGVSNTISMFIYVSILAPIIEEIIYRGFILRKLENHGKLLAIVISSIIFGFMHENIYQNIFGILIGFVFSYITIEYGIRWSILLHIINNCVLGELFYKVTSFLPIEISETIFIIFEILMFIGGVYVIIKNKNKIKQYIEDNKITDHKLKYALTSVGLILYMAYSTISAFQEITKI
ncbi:MAG: CPBP family intramembrane metalloprotease [Clostridia bacterium]|nr:CPBP family intramembrane metalloprotease [Clostridia bacterium]